MYIVRHRPLDNLAMHELGVMLERHPQILLRGDLGLGGHLWEA
jgi:hypothetical protein